MPHFNLEQLFWFLALFSTIVFILKTVVFLIVGGDCEVEADFDSFSETDSSFSFLSVQTILAFFMGFGWMGLVLLRQVALKMWLTLAIAFVIGVVFMFATAYLMFLVRKLDKKVVVKIEDYVGTEGKAYTEIKPQSEGKIEIVINKKLTILDAINLSDEKIDAFTPIKIEKVLDSKIYVNKV